MHNLAQTSLDPSLQAEAISRRQPDSVRKQVERRKKTLEVRRSKKSFELKISGRVDLEFPPLGAMDHGFSREVMQEV